ncbi:MAG: hypothetical protein ACRD0O_20665 [Acidimicrobiia bacterium]
MVTRPLAAARPHARVLADLLDAALAGDWSAGPADLAVLSWHGPGDDDLELATKRCVAERVHWL